MDPIDMMVTDLNCEYLGLSRLCLMESAGKSLAEEVGKIAVYSFSKPVKVVMFAGSGGNGGDVFVAARYLLNRGYDVDICMLKENIRNFEGTDVPLGSIDISLYRDDLTLVGDLPETGSTVIPCDLSGRKVILVDDVIYTGRTARAAIEAVFHYGRPDSIQLAVLIDRGHRELPIRPDYVGKNSPTSHSEIVSVMVDEYDGKTGVVLYQR